MSAVALGSLTRRLARISLAQAFPSMAACKALAGSNEQQCRFKSGGKGKKTVVKTTTKREGTANLQHHEWVKFQQSIAVDGFETGQTTKATLTALTGRKDRGGKQLRKRKEKELAESFKTERLTKAQKGGIFPTLRYSDEETERLLAEAYAAVPKRMGKRGTKNLIRQRVRWFRVRKIRAKIKKYRIRAHFRRMEERSRRVKEVLAVKESAAETRARDAAYQDAVFHKWTEKMLLQGDSRDYETHNA